MAKMKDIEKKLQHIAWTPPNEWTEKDVLKFAKEILRGTNDNKHITNRCGWGDNNSGYMLDLFAKRIVEQAKEIELLKKGESNG
jgi:hypothetical protein